MTWCEMIGMIRREKQAARITPAAPVGELSPARSALVSMNARNLFCIAFFPDGSTSFAYGIHKGFFLISRNTTSFLGEYSLCLSFQELQFFLKTCQLVINTSWSESTHVCTITIGKCAVNVRVHPHLRKQYLTENDVRRAGLLRISVIVPRSVAIAAPCRRDDRRPFRGV